MIYLDHAATSFPKPAAVLAAVNHWFTEVGVGPDRGDGARVVEASTVIDGLRTALARLTAVPRERVAFVSGSTEGLNLALRALLRGGEQVLTTPFEHASVARPLVALRDERQLQLSLVEQDMARGPDSDALCAAIAERRPQLVVFSHASNVTGGVYDARRICAAARDVGARTVLDVCQTAGLLPIDVGADVVIGSGHKALLGPPGTGFVAVANDLELRSQKQGGTGSSIALEAHPDTWPQNFEAGTANLPGLFGLAAAVEGLDGDEMQRRLRAALVGIDRIDAELRAMPSFRVLPTSRDVRTPVLSFVTDGFDPAEVGAILAGADIHVRSGFLCAPWLHQRIGTESGGVVRVSTGPETGDDDVEALLAVLRTLS